jgi:predicted dehydrogenase
MRRVPLGILGCGQISGIYLENLTQRFASLVEVRAVADLRPEAAARRAGEHGVARACSPEELLADPEIEVVVNLTNPWAHHELNLAALAAGKHVYTEKALAATRAEGLAQVQAAAAAGLRFGAAPDTFLGGGLQTCRKLLDDGWIGQPLYALAFTSSGIRNPAYYRPGIGPLLDMGPYYVTALVALLGPVRRVCASAQIPFAEKTFEGQTAAVETPTVVSGVLDFASGPVASLTATCECAGYTPRLEIWGSEGVLTCTDPNCFGGPVLVARRGERGLGPAREMPLTHGYEDNCRGLGVADLAVGIVTGRPQRASAELVFHVHDVMTALYASSDEGRHVAIESTCQRPAAMKAGWLEAGVAA